MPWAKYPDTEQWVRVRHWWREEEPNFPNGRDYVDFDEENPRVAVHEVRVDPKLSIGEKV